MLLEDTRLKEAFLTVRKTTDEICASLAPEDHVVQPVTDVSPPKWHLGHTTWFFETFILQPRLETYRPYNEKFGYLFNSYYESAGPRVVRSDRGNMTRPTVSEVRDYRAYVDKHMMHLLEEGEPDESLVDLVRLGLNHEQQHQELLLYDIKYILGNNPLFPVYGEQHGLLLSPGASKMDMIEIDQGIYEIGHEGPGFCFDNETGRHRVYLHSYGIMDRLVTNGEYLEFVNSGGYKNFRYWLSDGWEWVKENLVKAPLHWHFVDEKWKNYSLNGGLKEIAMADPVTHISFFEADAFAKWKGFRLPTEYEWEVACRQYGRKNEGNFMESGYFEPVAQAEGNTQFFGDVWEWTNSAYLAYPYYKAAEGAVGEYNGKFMINQMVLRGGSCATPANHIRLTYRNFFPPQLRWMFSGIRLAASL